MEKGNGQKESSDVVTGLKMTNDLKKLLIAILFALVERNSFAIEQMFILPRGLARRGREQKSKRSLQWRPQPLLKPVDNTTIDKSNVEYEDEVVAEICAESTSDHGINDCANTVNPEQPETNARPDDDDISDDKDEVGRHTIEYLEDDNVEDNVISDDEDDGNITIINCTNCKYVKDTRVISKTTDNGATYVCPLDSCLFMTQSAEDSLQTDHFSSCHPHTDITGVKFIAL